VNIDDITLSQGTHGDLLKQDTLGNLITQQPTTPSQEVENLKEALTVSLDVITKLSRSLSKATKLTSKQTSSLNYDVLEQLEDIDTLPSLIDLLKFIQSDPQDEMIRHERI